MKYIGKLYGRSGHDTYFPLIETSEDFDRIKSERDEAVALLREADCMCRVCIDKRNAFLKRMEDSGENEPAAEAERLPGESYGVDIGGFEED